MEALEMIERREVKEEHMFQFRVYVHPNFAKSKQHDLQVDHARYLERKCELPRVLLVNLSLPNNAHHSKSSESIIGTSDY
jgi:hypothetical protein